MKKLVTESLSDFLSESTKLDPTLGGKIDKDTHKLLDKDQNKDEHELDNYAEEITEEEIPKNSSTKKGFHDDIQNDTLENENFRKVLYTAKNIQLVLMTLQPGENIGMENHESDQFFRFEGGTGQCVINGNKYDVKDGDSILIPGGSEHDIINTSDEELLQMYTLYSPPNHADGAIYNTKEEAQEAEESGEDKFDETTE